MKNLFRCIALLLAAGFAGRAAVAQTVLSGTLNNPATEVQTYDSGNNAVDVASAAAFTVGDTVLIIQMKGATIDESNSASFGNITSIGEAGNYEFLVICDIVGNTVTFDQQFLKAYDATGYVQMIRVPTFTNVEVSGTLTENAWDVTNRTGGVLVFAASGYVRMAAGSAISMDGRGFGGGWDLNSYGSCNCGCAPGDPQYTDFFYPSGSCRSASKGEGIADSITTKEFGKGKQATGGGGANDHNAGGGGGANYGAGGPGGTTNNPSCFFGAYCRGQNPGVGGLGLGATYYSNAQNRIFAGSGGGSGHDNNSTGTPGANGGGIIIIIADSVDGNSRMISARGNGVLTPSQGDGAGGGGAGGTVVLDVGAFSPNTLNVNVSGGKGGDNNWGGGTDNCKGPGGGGGGGVIWSRTATLPGSVVTNVSGGPSGSQTGATCNGQTNGATAGGNGAILNNLTRQMSTTDYSGCNLLPVGLLSFTAKQAGTAVALDWATATESQNAYFEVQRAADGKHFDAIGQVPGAGNSQTERLYRFEDREPLKGVAWYRLRQVDFNGAGNYSEARMVRFNPTSQLLSDLYPNPVNTGMLEVELYIGSEHTVSLRVFDLYGKQLVAQDVAVQQGSNHVRLAVDALPDGVYFLKAASGARVEARKFRVAH